MVTTLKLDAVLGSQRELDDLYAKAIEEFERMLRASNCQIINISSSNSKKGFLSRKQILTIVWTGTSSTIKSTYTVHAKRGVFGSIIGAEFHNY